MWCKKALKHTNLLLDEECLLSAECARMQHLEQMIAKGQGGSPAVTWLWATDNRCRERATALSARLSTEFLAIVSRAQRAAQAAVSASESLGYHAGGVGPSAGITSGKDHTELWAAAAVLLGDFAATARESAAWEGTYGSHARSSFDMSGADPSSVGDSFALRGRASPSLAHTMRATAPCGADTAATNGWHKDATTTTATASLGRLPARRRATMLLTPADGESTNDLSAGWGGASLGALGLGTAAWACRHGPRVTTAPGPQTRSPARGRSSGPTTRPDLRPSTRSRQDKRAGATAMSSTGAAPWLQLSPEDSGRLRLTLDRYMRKPGEVRGSAPEGWDGA